MHSTFRGACCFIFFLEFCNLSNELALLRRRATIMVKGDVDSVLVHTSGEEDMDQPTPPSDVLLRAPKKVTVSDIIECLGLSRHQQSTICVVWLIWVLCGWVATLVPYVLDAAGEEHGDWARQTSHANVLSTHAKSLILFGAGIAGMVGNPLVGNLSDVKGRIFATMCACALCSATATGFALASNKWVLSFFVLLTPFSRDGITVITSSLLAEWLPLYWRAFFTVSCHAIWNVGRLALTLWWTVCPPSRQWTLFFLVSSVVPISVFLFLYYRGNRYESPRWLAIVGDIEGCLATLRLAAQGVPSHQLPMHWDRPDSLHVQSETGHAVSVQKRTIWEQMEDLRSPKVLRLIALLCVLNVALFFGSNGFFIWAITYFRGIGIDPRPSMIVAPIGKITSNLALIAGGPQRCLIDRWRRLPLMKSGFFGFGVALVLLCFSSGVVMSSVMVFMSHLFEEIVWTVGGLYMTEAFPTSIRNSALGVIFMVGHVGSIVSASIMGELMLVSVYLPMVVMACGLFLGFLVCLFIPPGVENRTLSDTSHSHAPEE